MISFASYNDCASKLTDETPFSQYNIHYYVLYERNLIPFTVSESRRRLATDDYATKPLSFERQ